MNKLTVQVLIMLNLLGSTAYAITEEASNSMREACIQRIESPHNITNTHDYTFIFGLTQGALLFTPNIKPEYKQQPTSKIVIQTCALALELHEEMKDERIDNFKMAYIFALRKTILIDDK